MCEVEIKDETSSDNETNQTKADIPEPNAKSTKKPKFDLSNTNDTIFSPFANSMTKSIEVLNLLQNNSSFNASSSKYTDEIQLIIEMQAKEHVVRMEILRAQLETAKLNRDIAEINKILLLRNLQ